MCVRVCLHVCMVCASEFIYWVQVSLMGSILLILGIDKQCVEVACVFGFCLSYKTDVILQDCYCNF